jgi:hypothetical protein
MKGPKIFAAFAAILVGGALLLAAAAPAGAAKAGGAYLHYVACGSKLTKNTPPSHVCGPNELKGAFFLAKQGTQMCQTKTGKSSPCVRYKICVDFPRGTGRCASGQAAFEGQLYLNKITSNIPGRHKVSWFVEGKRVGTFYFRVT